MKGSGLGHGERSWSMVPGECRRNILVLMGKDIGLTYPEDAIGNGSESVFLRLGVITDDWTDTL